MNDKKIILFDLDGVVIRPRHKYFSEKLSEEQNIPLDNIMPFFKGEYKKTAIGELEIKDVLPPYLEKWNWNGTVDEFLTYWFEGEKDLDRQMVKLIENLRKQGIKCYLVSDNEKNRAKYLRETVKLKDLFDGAFFSADLGVTKSDPSFFSKVLEKLEASANEFIYWDDDSKNADVAKTVGIESFVYDDYGALVRKLDELFPDEMKNIMAFDTDDFYCDLVFSGKIKVEKVKETDKLLAFMHTRPSYPFHAVIVPKEHIAKLTDVEDLSLISEIFALAKEIILEKNLDNTNFRIITNGGSFQDSKHLHFHLVSGDKK